MIQEFNATGFNLTNFLADIAAHSTALRAKIVAANLVTDRYEDKYVVDVHLKGTVTAQDHLDIQSILDSHDKNIPSPYKVMSLINPDFKGYPIENIDFKRHLKKHIALDKHIVMMPNGRPEKSQYLNGEDLIAEIRFTFESENYLLTKKDQHLFYAREDGSWSEGILIGHRTYDHTDLTDGSIVVEERIESREHIVSSMKAFLSGVIMAALGQTIDEVIVTITPFWENTAVERDKFEEFGTDEWKNYLSAVDLATTEYNYLAFPIDEHGTTVRDYMVGRLTY